MTTYRVIATADTHLRDRQFNRPDRAEDFRSAFRQVIDIAEEEGACAILQSGDLFDTNRPSTANVGFMFDLDTRLKNAMIPLYVVNGDHDKADPPWASLMDAASVDDQNRRFGVRMLINELVKIPSTPLTVYGLDFIGKTKERYLEIKASLPAADILMWHTMVADFCGFLADTSVKVEELPLDKYQVIALGDVHVREYRQTAGALVGYPGSSELCRTHEALDKTVTVLEFDETGKFLSYRFRPLKTRKALAYQLNTEACVSRALEEAASFKHENPIITARFDPLLENVVGRFYGALDPDKAILRFTALPGYERYEPDAPEGSEEPEKHVEDFLPNFLNPGTPAFDLGLACIAPEAPVFDLITAYIESVTDAIVKQ